MFQNFDRVFGARYDKTAAPDELHMAVYTTQLIVDCLPPAHDASSSAFHNYSANLYKRFERFHKLKDLDDAIASEGFSIQLASDNHPRKPSSLNILSNHLRLRFTLLGRLDDLEEAIRLQLRATELISDESPEKASFFSNLGDCLHARFFRLGHIENLEDAVALHRRAVELMPDDHPEKPFSLSSLGNSLTLRLDCLGHTQDFEDAIAAHRCAIQSTPDSHPGKPVIFNNLSVTFCAGYDRFGRLEDLEGAIEAQRRAVELTPYDHPDMPSRLSNLSAGLDRRFARLGVFQDVDDAIALQSRAVERKQDNDPEKAQLLHALCTSLLTRFERFRHFADLEHAIAAQRQAVELTPDGHYLKPLQLGNLAGLLQTRFDLHGHPEDIKYAILAQHQAVALTPDNLPGKASQLNNLNVILKSHFDQLGSLEDFEDVLARQRQAVELLPTDHPEKPALLSNIAGFLQMRFDRLGNSQDIQEAIAMDRYALELVPDGHSSRSIHLRNLAISLVSQLRQFPTLDHFTLVYECLTDATNSTAAHPYHRLLAAFDNARLCTQFAHLDRSREITLRAHQALLDAIPPFIWLGQSVSHRLEQLSEMKIGPAITSAASAAISAGRLSLALEWLEEGRNIVWGQFARLRDPLDDLNSHDSTLARRLRDVSVALEHAGQRSELEAQSSRAFVTQNNFVPSPFESRMALEDEARDHRRLAAEYETLVVQIRQIEGFGSFLRPKTFAELVPACRDGPVVVISVDQSRSDALILCSPGYVVHVPLPGLVLGSAAIMRTSLAKGIHNRGIRGEVQDDEPERGPIHRTHDSGLLLDLEVLWVSVVQPILRAIKNEVRLPHVTWCATGPLSFLPLHAAGIYRSKRAPACKTSDYVVSSYTTSLSTLLASRKKQVTPFYDTYPNILVVSQPKTPGQQPLPYTIEEASTVRKHFRSAVFHLCDAEGKVNVVFDAMREHEWVHLACHGAQDPGIPTKSAFYLYDGLLELSRLMSVSHPRAELAILSACQTAKGSDEVPEEAMHLSAGMLAAGYKSVVATMWSIADKDGPVLADALYAALKRNLEAGKGLRVAHALHDAVEELRGTVGETNFVRWVPFVHFGA
ncbi:CHAT domain-containing protein [Vararia minispora EC-137]|uniref:CHAT domain-containing protein n=1 Tax=Vararia minispora EC-137 TaxID=1314806 RepID=A0ACB8QFR0_9AGAM|nr:CHAT domain-containing protein [Vararia minispora EC-137]